MAKKILFVLCVLLLKSTALAFEASKVCMDENQYLICEYAGKTGLELFKNINLANTQRKPLRFKDFWGSIYRVKNVNILNRDKLACWGLTYSLQGPKVLIICKIEKGSLFKIPNQILSMIQELRKAEQ